MESLISGLVSGIIVTLLVVVFRSFWNGTIIPWFENRVYKDIHIEGSWFSLYPTVVGERQETITLERHGHEVTGTFICNTDHNEGEQYNIKGNFRNMILTLLYEAKDKQISDRGTITLKCVKSGKRMSGKIAIYQDRLDTIDVNELLWFRSKEDQKEFLSSILKRKERMKELREGEREASLEMKTIAQVVEADKDEDESKSEANKAVDSTSTRVTPPAEQESRHGQP